MPRNTVRRSLARVRQALNARASAGGQSMVEFVLVVPTLLFLVVIVADFGRVFAVGVALEAATRDGAEAAANEYLARPPGPLNASAPPGDPAYYASIHAVAGKTVCADTADLPNSNFDTASGECPGMPLIRACVHDSADTECGTEVHAAAIPTECTELTGGMSNAQAGPQRYVEVRTCYQFTPILQLPLLSFGEIWLQRTRVFAIPCYFVLGQDECG